MEFSDFRRNFGQESAGQQINGTSLVPAFDDPEGSAGMKDAAYSQFAKPRHPLHQVRQTPDHFRLSG